MGPAPLTPSEKIARSTIRRGDCLIWTGSTDKDGYGKAWHERKSIRAHRLSFLDANGYLPEYVLHTCDTPQCVEPSHLYEGTAKQNQKDRSERTGWAGVGRKVQTHCVNGHKYIGVKNSRGHNVCMTCYQDRLPERLRRQREKRRATT